jgi:uncharacterized membrane protein YdbT with pleckstrin-like domain/CRP-like cAMP-binding protein
MTENAEFLSDLPIFRGLDEDALEGLAAIAAEYEYDAGAIVAYQRDVTNRLIIVKSGRLFSRAVDRHGVARESRSYLPGEYFEELWLFAPSVYPATVKGAEDGRLLILEGTPFLTFVEGNREALAQMAPSFDDENNPIGLSPAAWEEAQKVLRKSARQRGGVTLLADELVEYQSRRSQWYLFLRLLGPFLFAAIVPLILFLYIPGERAAALEFLRWGVPGLLFLLALGLIFFRIIDWYNDFFVITNKHMTHHEFDLRHFRTRIVKIPISQIQSVEILKPTFITNLFNIGTARVTTAAQEGIVLFDNIDDPAEVRDTLTRLTERVRAVDEGMAQAAMRQSVERHFQVDPYLKQVEIGVPATLVVGNVPPRETLWSAFWRRYAWRDERPNQITYRKHFFALLKEAAYPLLILLGIMVSAVLLATVTDVVFAGWLLVALVIALLIALGYLIWEIEDWRNDLFQLTDRYAVDIDRRPFGFGESRKQASLGNIQNVNAVRPNFLATLFNYGNVNIETAGATSDIVFENVPSPSTVQADIFRKLDAFRQQQRIQEGKQRRDEYAVLLDVYKQATEQERIPRRTP